jgi:hypothetical protein
METTWKQGRVTDHKREAFYLAANKRSEGNRVYVAALPREAAGLL